MIMLALKILYFCLYIFISLSHCIEENSPVFLTPYINNGQIEEAKMKCAVTKLKTNVTSYSGFFTVKDTTVYKSNMFFWFFPSESGDNSPIILWLQGGPGASSMYGLFEINGPLEWIPKKGLKLREYRWTKTHHILYIDNPVGAGYSFTTSDEGYAKNENDVAENLLIALKQFFKLFPKYKNNDFFISGESYAGKYVPAIANAIDKDNENIGDITEQINLKGITVGNGFTDPENMMHYGAYLYQLGLIDENGLTQFENYEKAIVSYIKQKEYRLAFNKFDEMINGDVTPYKTLFNNLTGFTNYFNFILDKDQTPMYNYEQFIQFNHTKKAIHVGNLTFRNVDQKVELNLLDDIMRSVKPFVESLLDRNYKVLFINGQLDIIVGYPLTREFIKTLKWSGSDLYLNSKRQIYIVDNVVAGYIKNVKNFYEILIRDSGHIIPRDQPKWAFEIINSFTHNIPL